MTHAIRLVLSVSTYKVIRYDIGFIALELSTFSTEIVDYHREWWQFSQITIEE